MGLLFLPIALALNFSECFLFSGKKDFFGGGGQTGKKRETVALSSLSTVIQAQAF